MAKNNSPAPVGNMIIGQSGGPTVVINQSLVGAVLEAQKHKKIIQKIYGMRHGVKGVLKQDIIDLTAEPKANLLKVAATPSSALGSVRKKPTADECREIFKVLQAHNIRYYFYIGGNDSAETADILHTVAQEEHYDLCVFHIPKTIDNDLRNTDHCPGYGSAAKFVAQAFMGDETDNRSLPGIKINVVMGRDAGWLTAAAALGRVRPDSGPHLVYLPEVAFDEAKFVADVKKVYAKLGRCVVAASEGIRRVGEKPIAALFSKQVDSHGNAQLSGSGALGDYLAQLVRNGFAPEEIRIRADTYGYLQRSFAGVASKVDQEEARKVGELAVKAAVEGISSGTISIVREKGKAYKVNYKVSPLSAVAKVTRPMDPKFISKEGNNVTKAFIDYALPLTGGLPEIGFLSGKPVKKIKIK